MPSFSFSPEHSEVHSAVAAIYLPTTDSPNSYNVVEVQRKVMVENIPPTKDSCTTQMEVSASFPQASVTAFPPYRLSCTTIYLLSATAQPII